MTNTKIVIRKLPYVCNKEKIILMKVISNQETHGIYYTLMTDTSGFFLYLHIIEYVYSATIVFLIDLCDI